MVQTRYTKRSPMQGSPMHRSSGYHFRVDRGAASAFVVGVALIFAAVRLPTLEVLDFLDETPNKGPAWPRRTREFVVSDQRWQDWSIGERLGDMWHAAEEPVTLVARHGRTRNATIRHVHRDPDVALVQDFLTSSELKAIRKAFSLPFENYDRSIAYGMNISTGVRPVKTWFLARDELKKNRILSDINKRLLYVANHPFARGGARGARLTDARLEGATFELFDGGGEPATAAELSNPNERSSAYAANPRLFRLTVHLTDAPAAFPVYPFAREVEASRDDVLALDQFGGWYDVRASAQGVGDPLRVCEVALEGDLVDPTRARSAALGGGVDYWRRIRRTVDYLSASAASRYEDYYINATWPERKGLYTFTSYAEREVEAYGPGALAPMCAWLLFHRYERACETRAYARLDLRAGDAVIARVADERRDSYEQMRDVRALGGTCGAAPRLAYTVYVRARNVGGRLEADRDDGSTPDIFSRAAGRENVAEKPAHLRPSALSAIELAYADLRMAEGRAAITEALAPFFAFGDARDLRRRYAAVEEDTTEELQASLVLAFAEIIVAAREDSDAGVKPTEAVLAARAATFAATFRAILEHFVPDAAHAALDRANDDTAAEDDRADKAARSVARDRIRGYKARRSSTSTDWRDAREAERRAAREAKAAAARHDGDDTVETVTVGDIETIVTARAEAVHLAGDGDVATRINRLRVDNEKLRAEKAGLEAVVAKRKLHKTAKKTWFYPDPATNEPRKSWSFYA